MSNDLGYFNIGIDNLENNTIYEIRCYILYNNSYIYSTMLNIGTKPVTVITLVPEINRSVIFNAEVDGNIEFGEVGFEYRDVLSPDIIPSSIIKGIKNNNSFYASVEDLQEGLTYKVRGFYLNKDNDYSYGEWVEFDVINSSIESLWIIENIDKVAIFDILGNRLKNLKKGINIIYHSSGKVEKILIK